jgi:hypothetical protein
MVTCPKCGSNRIHQSRSRNAWERFRRGFTVRRIFRCHACNWRGWGDDLERPGGAAAQSLNEPPPPNMAAIDEAMERSTRERE